ncbi:MAG: hypothetical protein IKO72_05665 [Kiritimatiellae bacterium]|nr:hypothetical protein [Kiritimatiellia bacterium]
MSMIAMLAATAALNWTMPDGRVVVETRELAPFADGERLTLGREEILAKKAKRLDVIPDFAHAKKGEKGFWFTPYGVYGEYDRDRGSFFAGSERMPMPMFGWSNQRGAWLAVVVSLKYFVRETIRAGKDGYSIAATLEEELCRYPYEDLSIEYHRRPSGTPYADLAKIYRNLQLGGGVVKPFRERFKGNKVLEKAILSPEIRIREAWKPVPSPVLHQAPENEPEVKVAVTFDRVKDIVDEMKRQGIEDAELCLVGWNIGGHDGRWPQVFPSEPKLGGDAKLREAIRHALAAGYLIVPHGNFYEGYTISADWDGEWALKDADGLMLPTRNGTVSWGGGRPYHMCPQRAYEKFCSRDIPRMAAFGFKGIGYFDVVTICEPRRCIDIRHPCTTADGAKYWGACAAISKRDLGGFASESGYDSFAGNLDYSLYAHFGDPRRFEIEHAEGKGLAKRVIPVWQIVYHGIIAANPFTTTMNVTLKDRHSRLKAIEFSARPCFYFYSKFLSSGSNWMGEEDLVCSTDEELRRSVAKIKEGWDVYRRLRHLQLEYVDAHEELAPGVFRTGYSNGESVIVNYTAAPYAFRGKTVDAQGWRLVDTKEE